MFDFIFGIVFGSSKPRRNPMVTTDELDEIIRSTFDFDANCDNALAWMTEQYPIGDLTQTTAILTMNN